MNVLNEIGKIWSAVFMSTLLGMCIYEGTKDYGAIEYAMIIGIAYADFRIVKEVLVDATGLIERKWKEAQIKKLSVEVKGA